MTGVIQFRMAVLFTSLISLANQKQLPLHQFMDEETLKWIKCNNPFGKLGFTESYGISNKLDFIKRFVPNKNWFLKKAEINSIHGIRHLVRATIYSFVLFDLNNNKKDIPLNPLMVAASLHDIRRQNDNADVGHAKRTSIWFDENVENVMKFYKCKLTTKEIELVTKTILFHEVSYNDLMNNNFYEVNPWLIDILKTADALDRYIQPKLKWRINEKYLKIIPNSQLKAFAYNLVIASENNFLADQCSEDSIFNTFE